MYKKMHGRLWRSSSPFVHSEIDFVRIISVDRFKSHATLNKVWGDSCSISISKQRILRYGVSIKICVWLFCLERRSYFLIAFLHILHVAVGLIALIVVFIKNLKGAYHKNNFTGFELASIFWHFVDILWIYLFIFLVFFG